MSTGNLTLARRGLAAIETVVALDGAAPTPEQRDILAAWPGWGPLAPAFDPDPDPAWAQITDAIYAALADDLVAVQLGKEAVDNAFYTSDVVVDTIWDLVTAAGFTGGRVLEPGCGSGRFMDRAPALHAPVEFVGVERDRVTARIAQALHPAAHIIPAPLEKTTLKVGSFDLAIGNVPFSSQSVSDYHFGIGTHSLHSYFFARALAAVRHGGYVAIVVSRHLMDTDWISAVHGVPEIAADFVGAIRLPTGTFRGEGTDVVSDIVLFRRNMDPEARVIRAPRPTIHTPTWNTRVSLSDYWATHPEYIAGGMSFGDHHARQIVVSTPDIPTAIRDTADTLRPHLLPYLDGVREADYSDVVLTDHLGRKEGSFHLTPFGEVVQIKSAEAVPVRRTAELVALVGIRDAAVTLTEAEADYDTPDHALTPLRDAARAAWEAYVGKFGPINRGQMVEGAIDPDTDLPKLTWKRPTLGGFRADPDYITVLAIEQYNPDTQTAEPAPILLRRVNKRPEPIHSVDTPAEALAVALGESGTVNVERVASLLGITPDEVPVTLGDLVYADPEQDGKLTPARTYLSGNVRRRLTAARTAAESDAAYARNVAALETVLPADLGPLEIDASLGMPWITPKMIEDFAREVIGIGLSVTHEPVTASWIVDGHGHGSSAAAKTTFGTPRMDAAELIKYALNGKAPIVYDELRMERGKTRKVRNAEQTLSAQDKLSTIQERFGTWLWEDEDRCNTICRVYNERLNSHVTRRPDGSYLTFPTADGVTLWPWQQDVVEQIVTSQATFCAHAVGAGKTLSMVSAAMQLRKLGLAQKPMIAVPNHLLEQIAREARQAYPTGRFLIADKDALAGEARRVFAARCATGDWDAVIITHSSFGSIPVSPQTEQDWLMEQKWELEDALRRGSGGYAGSKEIARRVRSLENSLEKLRANVGDTRTVRFEQLGIDWAGIDEAHLYKRLPINSRSEGFSFGASKRATDLFLKIGYLRNRAEGRPHVAFFSGTPWTNSLAETFVWMRYLQPDLLAEIGLTDFDAWAAVFVKRETKVEIAPDGSGFRIATRPTALTNVPELRTLFFQCADVLPPSALPLERPDALPETVVVPQSNAQAEFAVKLVERADRLRNENVDPHDDNMLKILGEGRRVALDPNLVGIRGSVPKITAIVKKIMKVHRAHQNTHYGDSPTPGALQMVFCDQGTPNTVSQQTYGRLRAALVKKGMDPRRIRFIHEATTDHAKAALFAACRDGQVSVLVGSTEKVGMGTNVQTRLAAMHHLDAPWRPSDVEQRDGRGIRPGNLNTQVHIYRYVTERSLEAFMWETLQRKARFIAQMFSLDLPRTVEDIGDVELDYAHIKGLATGNPLVMEHAEISATVKRLRTLRAVDAQSVRTAHRRATERLKTAQSAQHTADLYEEVSGLLTTPTDPADLEQFGLDVHKAARSGKRRNSWETEYARTSWRPGVTVKLTRVTDYNSNTATWRLVAERGYRTVLDQQVKPGHLARSVDDARDVIEHTLTHWESVIPTRAARIRAEHAAATANMAEAEEMIAGFTFSRETDLHTAEERLAEIEAIMENDANTPAKLAA